ncbi:septal ring lytic transglycosylase RlpA family protein [Leeia speluncae]|nr:septal ring lytic transglycosylase RlpA family protein [Leeia speluncae]
MRAGISTRLLQIVILAISLFYLAGCTSTKEPTTNPSTKTAENKPKSGYIPGSKSSRDPKLPPPSKEGGYYMDDGPPDNIPQGLENTPDAQPKDEPLNRFANKPYNVLGDTWVPDTSNKPYVAEGLASWYGKKFHGKKTSSGEPYDVYGMSAAHRTLPIPSYAKITNLANGKTVIVRVNDRGPFHSERVIDLSYAAAFKLGYSSKGSTKVRVERVFPNDRSISPTATQLAKQDDTGNLPAQQVDQKTSQQQAAVLTGIYLQLGSFSQRNNAEAMVSRLSSNLSVPTGKQLQVLYHKNLHKVVLGQFTSEQEARASASDLKSQSGINSLLLRP